MNRWKQSSGRSPCRSSDRRPPLWPHRALCRHRYRPTCRPQLRAQSDRRAPAQPPSLRPRNPRLPVSDPLRQCSVRLSVPPIHGRTGPTVPTAYCRAASNRSPVHRVRHDLECTCAEQSTPSSSETPRPRDFLNFASVEICVTVEVPAALRLRSATARSSSACDSGAEP